MTEIAPTSRRRTAGARGDWRLILLIGGFFFGYLAVGVKMGSMALSEPEEPPLTRTDGRDRPVRAEIVDAGGRLLAANLPGWSLYAHPHEVKNPAAAARALAGIFPDVGRKTFLRRLAAGRRFVWLKRPITPRQKQAVLDLGLPGLFFGSREMRIYPAARSVAHIVGGVEAEHEAVNFARFAGAGGVEQYFNKRLSDAATAGRPLRLSLDLTVQHGVREILEGGMRRLTAKGAAAVLMRVRTGEIVAMVSLPDYDPNHRPRRYRGPREYNPRFNRAALGRYEMGSTFKVLTAAMAIDSGIADARTVIQTPPRLKIAGETIGESHRMDPSMSLEDVIVRSSNVGAAKLAVRLGSARFRRYLKALGVLEPTGIELTEAARARPLVPRPWREISTVTVAYGHGLSISPVHLAAAYATIAGGGVQVRPTLVAGGRKRGERVFSQATATEMLRIMRQVVVRGTARRADVPGFEVGGKTGTAEKPIRGIYRPDKVVSTFGAIFPTSAPEYVLVVSLDEPTDRSGSRPERSAGRTAVPVAGAIIRRLGPLLGLRPRTLPENVLTAAVGARVE